MYIPVLNRDNHKMVFKQFLGRSQSKSNNINSEKYSQTIQLSSCHIDPETNEIT